METCAELVRAMEAATTVTERRRLAYLFTRRARPCGAALPHLIAWLEDADEQVAEDAADAIGVVLALIRSARAQAAAREAAGPPLLRYARAHPTGFTLTALGVTAHPPARPFLEEVAAGEDALASRLAKRALRNFDWFSVPENAGRTPPFWSE